MTILHWVPQLQVHMHLMKTPTIRIMGSYNSGLMTILHWVPQLQVHMHLMKTPTIRIMGSYTSGLFWTVQKAGWRTTARNGFTFRVLCMTRSKWTICAAVGQTQLLLRINFILFHDIMNKCEKSLAGETEKPLNIFRSSDLWTWYWYRLRTWTFVLIN